MKNIDIKRIINEEIAKMYEETGLLNNFLNLKEAVLKFNRLIDSEIGGFEKCITNLTNTMFLILKRLMMI